MRLHQVYLASASPPVRHANVYGVDMPTRREFVAFNLSEEEICTVGACSLARTCSTLYPLGICVHIWLASCLTEVLWLPGHTCCSVGRS